MRLRWIAIYIVCLFFAITGMVFANDFSHLKKEFEEYKGSDYLIRNMERREKSTYKEDKGMEEFKIVTADLRRRKDLERDSIKQVVIKNGLFEPETNLLEMLDKGADAEEILKSNYSINTVLTIALRNNLDIQSAYKGATAAIERYDQVSNLDEILNQYAVFTRNLELNIGEPMRLNKLVIMNFPFPGMLTLKGNIVEKDIDISKIELKRRVQDIITEIKESYYETAYLYSAIQIMKDVLDILQRMGEAVRAVYIAGRASLNDMVKIQMEIDRMENELIVFEERKKAIQLKMNKLLNIREEFIPEGFPDIEPVRLEYTKETLLRIGEKEILEIKGLTARLERMRLMIEMAEKEFYPDFTVGFSLFQNRITRQVGTGAEEPAFSEMPMVRSDNWFGKNDAYIRETKVKYKEMEMEIGNMKNMTVSNINDAIYRYENADRSYRLYKSKLVPKSEVTVDIAEALYINKRIDFMDLINSQDLYLKNNLMLKEAVRDMNIEAARIERLVGSAIKRR
jgi:hypothetical protein